MLGVVPVNSLNPSNHPKKVSMIILEAQSAGGVLNRRSGSCQIDPLVTNYTVVDFRNKATALISLEKTAARLGGCKAAQAKKDVFFLVTVSSKQGPPRPNYQ